MISAASKEQCLVLDAAVSDLLVQAEARGVLLLAHDGNVLAKATLDSAIPADTLAALACGVFAATREMANVFREPGFQSISHEGENICMHVRGATAGFLVLTVFDRRTTMGLVKLYADKMVEEIEPVLQCVSHQNAATAGCGDIEADEMGAIFPNSVMQVCDSHLVNSRT